MNVVFEFISVLAMMIYYILEAFVRLFIPPSPKSVRNQIAVVTGAGRGIGRALALRLGREGATVAVWDLNEETAKETAQLICDEGGKARAYGCDVTDIKMIADVAARVRQELGEVEILINNAGLVAGKLILDSTEKDIRRVIEVNLVSQFWTVKEFLPQMIARKRGHILILCSMAGKYTTQFVTEYCASKFAVNGFSGALVDDLRYMKADFVHVTTVYPDTTQTRMLSDALDQQKLEFRSRFPLMTPEYVAECAINGLLRNYRYVHVPPHAVIIDFINLLPIKAGAAIKEAMATGFFNK